VTTAQQCRSQNCIHKSNVGKQKIWGIASLYPLVFFKLWFFGTTPFTRSFATSMSNLDTPSGKSRSSPFLSLNFISFYTTLPE
jgi:hypothetical protein